MFFLGVKIQQNDKRKRLSFAPQLEKKGITVLKKKVF